MKEQTIINTRETTLIVKKNVYNVIINTETFFVSMLKDIFSIFMLLSALWFNYNFLGNSYIMIFIIILMLFGYSAKLVFIFLKSDRYFFNVSYDNIEKIKQQLKQQQ
jgi:hypothetical protein